MSEEKLTVAELLARREKERGDSAASEDRPRRRRRSLEEGGVSVAELTGGIPRVKAAGPRRGAHAVVEDEDRDDRHAARPAEAAESSEATEAAEVSSTEEAAAAEERVAERAAQPVEEPVAEAPVAEEPVADEPAAEVADEPVAEEPEYEYVPEPVAERATERAPEPPAEEPVVEAPVDEVSAEEPVAEVPAEEPVVAKPAPERVAEPAAAEEPAETRDPFAVPQAVPVDPRPVMANDETGEITFTFTKFHDARTASRPVADIGPVAREVLQGSMAYDDRPTNILPVIDDGEGYRDDRGDEPSPASAKTSEFTRVDGESDDRAFDGSAIAGAGAVGGAAAMADHVDDVPAAYREREREHAEHPVGADAFDGPDHEDAEATRAFDGSSLTGERYDDARYDDARYDDERYDDRHDDARYDDERYDDRRDDARYADEDFGEDRRRDAADFDGDPATAEAPAVPESGATKKSRDDYAEDNSLSIGLLIAQTVVGLLIGGLVFALFTFLWVSLPVPVVAVIAVVFALGLVVAVNLVRRERDRLTPILAGIVGLVVSFAPYVITLL